MEESPQRPLSKPAVVLGLTFLIIGLSFALPLKLLPEGETGFIGGLLSPEASNVYAITAWAGWAHFIFAFRGQSSAILREKKGPKFAKMSLLLLAILGSAALLLWVRSLVGSAIFGAVVWLYFIDHFLKAERVFSGIQKGTALSSISTWVANYQLLLSFGWLSAVLLNLGGINNQPWVLWGVSLAVGTLILLFGGWKSLAEGKFGDPLLALFFIGEALVWGAYSRYGGPSFLAGVYVFHIAAGSFFHYLGAYFFAQAKTTPKDQFLSPVVIVGVNVLIVGLGLGAAHLPYLSWLNPIVGAGWFTLWVGVHLIISDVFPYIKNLKTARSSSA